MSFREKVDGWQWVNVKVTTAADIELVMITCLQVPVESISLADTQLDSAQCRSTGDRNTRGRERAAALHNRPCWAQIMARISYTVEILVAEGGTASLSIFRAWNPIGA